jgi:cell division protein DivIC
MSRLGSVIGFLRSYKYYIVIFASVVLVGFADENSVWNHIQNRRHINDMREDIDKYNNIYNKDMRELRMLDRNPKAIEKIARERYFMKADDEDIFVLSDDENKSKNY